jgi:outer membrane protein OmpA-like peptidoglycan-associated protein
LDTGLGWQAGAGIRLKRPHDNTGRGLDAVSPWLDADALYVRTGPLDRFGFAVGAGLAFPIGHKRHVWLGPFVRYFQVVQLERVNYNNDDAKILSVGLSLEIGNARGRKEVALAVVPAKAPVVIPPPIPAVIPPPVVVEIPKVVLPVADLNVVIQFNWDDYSFRPDAYPGLEKAAKVLNDNPSYDAIVMGHASSEGDTEHNQILSENRAKAVMNYLVEHGVAEERLRFEGFGSSVSVKSNNTLSGRKANRRVTFRMEPAVASPGSAK